MASCGFCIIVVGSSYKFDARGCQQQTNKMAKSVAVKDLVWNEDRFKEGIDLMKHLYQVKDLFREQICALRGFFQGKDLFFSAPTGYGKSLVFHAIPIVADFLMEKLVGTSCIIVVSPLQSLMLDQVSKLKEVGINAAAIYADQTEEILQEIEEGYIYSIVFVSPESMLGTSRWRKYLQSEIFSTLCVGIVFDEAHCIAQW